MAATFNSNPQSSMSFFSSSSIIKKASGEVVADNDPVPLGLSFKESFKNESPLPATAGGTMGPSPTNTFTGPDSCLDIDYEF